VVILGAKFSSRQATASMTSSTSIPSMQGLSPPRVVAAGLAARDTWILLLQEDDMAVPLNAPRQGALLGQGPVIVPR